LAVVDDRLITLLAGERHRFTIATDVLDVAPWLDALRPADGRSRVLRAAGDRTRAGVGSGQ